MIFLPFGLRCHFGAKNRIREGCQKCVFFVLRTKTYRFHNFPPVWVRVPFRSQKSDPIFGSEMAPEPKREENYGIYMFLFLTQKTHISGTPLGSDFWLRNGTGAQTGGKSWNLYVFVFTIRYISGTPLGSDFWLRNGSGAQTGGK